MCSVAPVLLTDIVWFCSFIYILVGVLFLCDYFYILFDQNTLPLVMLAPMYFRAAPTSW